MLRRLFVIAVTAVLASGAAYADQTKPTVTISVNRINPTSGRQMYGNYCAPCHGQDGKGSGPVASALRTAPPDLTALSRSNHGKFPNLHVLAVLQDGAAVPAHSSAEMPVWGPILGKMKQANPQDRMLRISNLSRFLDSIQLR